MHNQEKPPTDPLDDLKKQLIRAGIDVSQWGKGSAKTLEHLQKEITDGEVAISMDTEGNLLRKVFVGAASVYFISKDGIIYRLQEEKQIFKDGRERRRNLGQAISEKMKPNEDPHEAIIRGIQEELQIQGTLHIQELETKEKFRMSDSYPGLQSQYVGYNFEVFLSDDQFKPEGYVENQLDKSTYFIWEEVHE